MYMKKIKLSASTNPPLASELFRYIEILDDSEIDCIHCDVMDGKFVENFALSYSTVKNIKKSTHKSLEIHLMVEEISKFALMKYCRLKPHIIDLHYESFKNKERLKSLLLYINKKGIKAGLAINPNTTPEEVEDILPYVGHILVMSVNPGLSGQKMIESCIPKIKKLKKLIKKFGADDVTFEIDGGINIDNIDSVIKAGYDMAVSGKALYVSENKNAFISTFTSGASASK